MPEKKNEDWLDKYTAYDAKEAAQRMHEWEKEGMEMCIDMVEGSGTFEEKALSLHEYLAPLTYKDKNIQEAAKKMIEAYGAVKVAYCFAISGNTMIHTYKSSPLAALMGDILPALHIKTEVMLRSLHELDVPDDAVAEVIDEYMSIIGSEEEGE